MTKREKVGLEFSNPVAQLLYEACGRMAMREESIKTAVMTSMRRGQQPVKVAVILSDDGEISKLRKRFKDNNPDLQLIRKRFIFSPQISELLK